MIIVLVSLISGIFLLYSQQKRFLNSIKIDGYEYQFNTNLYEVAKVPSDNNEKIKNLLDENKKICISFDNSSETDNAIFAVVSFNIVYKLTRYYLTKENYIKTFEVCNDSPIIELRGPNTGAKENSVRLKDEKIIIQGMNKKEVEMAADKLILIVFDVRLS
jgi:hypothetical protein